jgi:hypothetical protein
MISCGEYEYTVRFRFLCPFLDSIVVMKEWGKGGGLGQSTYTRIFQIYIPFSLLHFPFSPFTLTRVYLLPVSLILYHPSLQI